MMSRAIISSLLLLVSFSVYSDASIDIQNQDKSFLLSAPGTVTGYRKGTENSANRVMPTLPAKNKPQQRRSKRYKYVGESRKFRQFGQQPGQNNPWFQEYNQAYPRQTVPLNNPAVTNPWQLGGMPPLQGMLDSQQGQYSTNPNSTYRDNQYSRPGQLYPDFPDGIYRDTNPAAGSLPGFNNNFMPGFGGGDSKFPFSPFGLF